MNDGGPTSIKCGSDLRVALALFQVQPAPVSVVNATAGQQRTR